MNARHVLRSLTTRQVSWRVRIAYAANRVERRLGRPMLDGEWTRFEEARLGPPDRLAYRQTCLRLGFRLVVMNHHHGYGSYIGIARLDETHQRTGGPLPGGDDV